MWTCVRTCLARYPSNSCSSFVVFIGAKKFARLRTWRLNTWLCTDYLLWASSSACVEMYVALSLPDFFHLRIFHTYRLLPAIMHALSHIYCDDRLKIALCSSSGRCSGDLSAFIIRHAHMCSLHIYVLYVLGLQVQWPPLGTAHSHWATTRAECTTI